MSAEFKKLFDQYFDALVDFAKLYTQDHSAAEDVVQSVFIKVWENQSKILEQDNPKYYLYRAVKNRCLNYIRDIKKMSEQELDTELPAQARVSFESQIEGQELAKQIDAWVDELPPACRRVFLLSRKEELSHKEISDLLEISTKTVENQITKALKHLRSKINR